MTAVPGPCRPDRRVSPGRHPGSEAGDRTRGRHREDIRIGTAPDLRHTRKLNKMARLVGVDLPREKRVEVALTYIFGVGRTCSKEGRVLRASTRTLRVRDLGDEEPGEARDYLEANVKMEAPGARSRGHPPQGRDRLLRGPRGTVAVSRARSAHQDQRVPARARSALWPARRRLVSNAPQEPYGCRRQEGAPQGEEERRPRARSHQEHVQQHHHLDHGPQRCCDLVGVRRPGRFQGLPKSTPFAAQMAAEAAARRAMEHGMRKVDVFVKGRVPVARPLSAP